MALLIGVILYLAIREIKLRRLSRGEEEMKRRKIKYTFSIYLKLEGKKILEKKSVSCP